MTGHGSGLNRQLTSILYSDTMDKKAQMMDAGTALFSSEEGFGSTLGAVKAAMEAGGGKIYRKMDADASVFPATTGEFDLFLDFSTRWRNRYVSCTLEDAGMTPDGLHRYAAVFKQGDSSSRVRDYTLLTACVAIILVASVAPGVIRIVSGVLLLLLIAYVWISPSEKGQERVKDIISSLQQTSLPS